MRHKRKTKLINNILHYYCTKCNIFKIEESFEKRPDNIKKIRSHCKECRKFESAYYHRTVRHRMNHKDTIIDINKHKQWKADPLLSLKKYLIRLSKSHSKTKNIKFSITIDDIEIPKKCPLLNIPFNTNNTMYSYSIDKINNSKGYIKGYIAVISRLENMMKNAATFEELTEFSKNIKTYIKR